MQDNISKIKDRLGIVDVVSGYLKLQKAGINFKAPCPFHNEKTPSFFVSPDRQIWHCFGCQKGGDIFTFIKEIEGVEFPEALRILAVRAGIELEEFDSTLKDSKDRLFDVCETAARFFEKQLGNSNVGKLALEYLKNRGLKAEMITQFRLGFAPDTWDSLSGYLRNCGFTAKEIIDAGMAIKKESGNVNQESRIYDRFRSRVMFPISDTNGRVIGFTGRIFEETGNKRPAYRTGRQETSAEVAKYINTPQTLIYDKSRILYALNQSRGDIRKNDKCLLVEGNMDAIMSYQAGVRNVVASSGTALTPMHLAILKRYTANFDFCFDTDQAGAVATKRGIGMALSQDINVRVISIDDRECKDPADYVKKYGQGWEKLVASAKPVVDFYFDKAKENYNPQSAESKKNVILAVAPFIKRLSSRVEKAHWMNQLAYLLRVNETAVESDIMSAPDELNAYETAIPGPEKVKLSSVATKVEAPDMLNEALLSLIFKNPLIFKNDIISVDRQFLNPWALKVLAELAKEDLNSFSFDLFIKKFDSERSLDLEFIHLKAQALWDGFKDDELKTEFANIFNKLKQKTVRLRLADLEYEMKAAEAAKDRAKITDLASKFNQLTQELAEIHKI